MDSALSECRRVFVLFCPIIIQTISLPCSLPLQGAEGTQPLLCLLISSCILLGSFCFLYLFFYPYSCMANLILCPCLHFYMELPCMHHMGHITSMSIKTSYLNDLCCLHPNIIKDFCSSDTHFINEMRLNAFVILTVAHVCV